MMRRRHQGGATLVAWSASTFGTGEEYGFHAHSSLPSGPTTFRMYYVTVKLYRASTGADVAFTGLEVRF